MAERDKTPDAPGEGAPVKASPGEGAPDTGAAEAAAISPETASLLGLIDKLSSLLERSELVELEVEAGETGIVLRKPATLASAAVTVAAAPSGAAGPADSAAPVEPAVPVSTAKAVRAPLTGIYYAAPSPSAPPYVTVGQQVAVGQVIGLIEAMKLFNEIKSDVSGKVVRMVAESGKLVKAKQPLLEVEP
jgi:acetyl-CoA carboxylase biotin carboxyl carrier protein